jgi:hypothetical protein
MSSDFRQKYLNKDTKTTKPQIKFGAMQINSSAKTHDGFYPYPSQEIRQAILQRIYMIAKINPAKADALLTGSINTIAAVFGDQVAAEAAMGIGNMIGELLSEEGMYLEHQKGNFSMSQGKISGETMIEAQYGKDSGSAWADNDGITYSEDIKDLLAQAASKKMTMN